MPRKRKTTTEAVAERLAELQRAHEGKVAADLKEYRDSQLALTKAGDNINALRFSRIEELIETGHTAAENWRTTTGAKVDVIREAQLTSLAQCDKHEEALFGPHGDAGIDAKVTTHQDRFRYMLIAVAIIGPFFGGFLWLEGGEIKERGILNRTEKELAAIIDARIWRFKRTFSQPKPTTTTKSTSENPPISPDS